MFYLLKKYSFFHHEVAPKDEFLEPQLSKPITASACELYPSFIAMVREQTFSGKFMKTLTIIYGSLSILSFY
jgi:hypothetical protein